MADSDATPGYISGSEGRDDILEPLVPSRRASSTDSDRSTVQIQIVDDDQALARTDRHRFEEETHRLATEIHEPHRLEDMSLAPFPGSGHPLGTGGLT